MSNQQITPPAFLVEGCPVGNGRSECSRGCGGWNRISDSQITTQFLEHTLNDDGFCGPIFNRLQAAPEQLTRAVGSVTEQYLNDFMGSHDVAQIPEPHQASFADFLHERAAVRSLYLVIPESSFTHKPRKGVSLQLELVGEIERSILKLDGRQNGSSEPLNYPDAHPEEHQALLTKNRKDLIGLLDETTGAIFLAAQTGAGVLT